ncbi:MAG: hypothetical protein ACI4O0_01010, partial [Candidatus Limivicinus sp.]
MMSRNSNQNRCGRKTLSQGEAFDQQNPLVQHEIHTFLDKQNSTVRKRTVLFCLRLSKKHASYAEDRAAGVREGLAIAILSAPRIISLKLIIQVSAGFG